MAKLSWVYVSEILGHGYNTDRRWYMVIILGGRVGRCPIDPMMVLLYMLWPDLCVAQAVLTSLGSLWSRRCSDPHPQLLPGLGTQPVRT